MNETKESIEVEKRLNSPIGITLTILVAVPPAVVTVLLIFKFIGG